MPLHGPDFPKFPQIINDKRVPDTYLEFEGTEPEAEDSETPWYRVLVSDTFDYSSLSYKGYTPWLGTSRVEYAVEAMIEAARTNRCSRLIKSPGVVQADVAPPNSWMHALGGKPSIQPIPSWGDWRTDYAQIENEFKSQLNQVTNSNISKPKAISKKWKHD